MICGIAIDHMHAVLLGVCRQLLRSWLEKKYHKEIWYIGSRIKELDECLLAIKPPAEIKQTLHSILSTRKYWKNTYYCMVQLA